MGNVCWTPNDWDAVKRGKDQTEIEKFNRIRKMNTKIITETARETLEGDISFPEVVGQLLTAGVEYYHVGDVRIEKISFTSAEGDAVVIR